MKYIYIHMKVKVKWLSHVRLFVTPWTVAYQVSASMGFSRQEYWGLNPCLLHCRQMLYPLSHHGSVYISISISISIYISISISISIYISISEREREIHGHAQLLSHI